MANETYVCKCCEKPCELIEIDCGIGAYEYWGAKGVHTDFQLFSECCEDEYWTTEEHQEYLDEKAEGEEDE